jgi:molybdate transport system substrate-binding protein
VFAAASLTDAFTEIAAEFERANPGAEVTFNFAASSALRAQLEQGARADAFASADTAQMNTARQNGVISGQETIFARNSLVIITPKANPGGVSAPRDLSKSGLKLVLAAPEVPVGNYARQMLMNMDRDPATYGAGFNEAALKNLASNESNVRQVVAKVELGEADAGIVYGTDVTASVAPNLNVIQVPGAVNVIAEYPIAVTKEARNGRAGQAFVDYVLSPAGQAILKKYSFAGI